MKPKTFKEAFIEADLKAKVDKFNGVPEKTYPVDLKVSIYVLAAIFAVISIFCCIFSVGVGIFMLLMCGILFLAAKSMKTKDDIATVPAAPSVAASSAGGLKVEEFYAAGVMYYEKDIKKLAVRNELWRKQTKTLLSQGKAGKSVFRYNFINKPVKLIPEPTNEHDKNAVIVQIAGERVGYIRAEEALHVKDILANHDIKYISAFISGGEYKIPTEDGDLIRGEDALKVKVKIGYIV